MRNYLIILISFALLACDPVINTGEEPTLGAPGDPRFAYIPLTVQNNEVLQVINTHTGYIVESIIMPAKSSGVQISSGGDRVYVAHREAGSVTVVNALNNVVLFTKAGVGTTPKGMTLDEANDLLWVAVDGGVTSVNTINGDVIQYPGYTYTGLDVERVTLNGNEYVVSLGYNGADAGFSLIDLNDSTEVSTYSLGSITLGGMTTDKAAGQIFVADSTNRTTRVLSFTITSPPQFSEALPSYALEDITDPNLTVNGVAIYDYDAVGSIDNMLFAAYGVSGYAGDFCALDSGGLKVLNRDDGSNLYTVNLGAGNWTDSTSQPMLVSVRDDGTLIVVHAVVCTDDNGVFLSQLQVAPPDDFNSDYVFTELSRTSLGVALQLVGDVIGPECALCPFGQELEPDKVQRPSAISPWLLLLILPLLFMRRMKFPSH